MSTSRSTIVGITGLTSKVLRVLRPRPETLPQAQPYGLKIGKDSRLLPPRQLDGEAYIQIGDRTTIGKDAWLSAYDHYQEARYSPSLVIGNDVCIGNFACITCISGIVIEDGCLFSEFVYISDHVHGFSPEGGLLKMQPLVSKGAVHIGAHTFVGYRACVLPGVILGQHCVVGANSVVTRSYPDYSMVAGVPARLMKRYSFGQHAWIPAKDEIEDRLHP
jgi:acetyltransferase-like isoleucine patch superfamily enzyme